MASEISFPWEMFMQAQKQKNQNRQNMYQNIAGIGQGLGQGLASIGDIIGEQKKKALLQQILQAQKNQSTPVVGPTGYVPPNQSPTSTAVPAGSLPPPNPSQMQGLLTQYDPQGMVSKMENQAFPSAQDKYINWKMNQGPKQGTDATPQQAIDFLGDTPENRKFLTDFKGNIPWSVLKAQRTANLQNLAIEGRKTLEKGIADRSKAYKVNTIYNQLNQLSASSGNVLGQAATIQFRSQRALDLLNSGNVKNDALAWSLVNADLAAIAQGGSPSIAAQAEASMPTFKQQASSLYRKISSNPQIIEQPEIKKQINGLVRVMAQTSGDIIDQNTQSVKALWKGDPEATQMINDAVQYIGRGVKPMDPSQMPPLPSMPGVPMFGSDDPSSASNEDLMGVAQ